MRKIAVLIIFVSAELLFVLIAAASCASEDSAVPPTPLPTPTHTSTPATTPVSEPISTPVQTPTSPTPAPTQAFCSWLDSWDTTLDSISIQIDFVYQAGSKVGGIYDRENGQLSGIISGNTLTGTWGEEPTYSSPNDAGEFIFTMSPDCQSFAGRWRYGTTGTWSEWNGIKVSQ